MLSFEFGEVPKVPLGCSTRFIQVLSTKVLSLTSCMIINILETTKNVRHLKKGRGTVNICRATMTADHKLGILSIIFRITSQQDSHKYKFRHIPDLRATCLQRGPQRQTSLTFCFTDVDSNSRSLQGRHFRFYQGRGAKLLFPISEKS